MCDSDGNGTRTPPFRPIESVFGGVSGNFEYLGRCTAERFSFQLNCVMETQGFSLVFSLFIQTAYD